MIHLQTIKSNAERPSIRHTQQVNITPLLGSSIPYKSSVHPLLSLAFIIKLASRKPIMFYLPKTVQPKF